MPPSPLFLETLVCPPLKFFPKTPLHFVGKVCMHCSLPDVGTQITPLPIYNALRHLGVRWSHLYRRQRLLLYATPV